MKGLVHPPDAVIAYVRYVPSSKGSRRRKGRRYLKLYDLEERREFLAEKYPYYLRFDPVFSLELQAVPLSRISRHYVPSTRLRELLSSASRDSLEEKAVNLALLIKEEAGIPLSSIGISGSILVGLHTENSDIDIVVRGEREGCKVYEAMALLFEECGELKPYSLEGLKKLYEFRSKDTPIPFGDFARMEGRKRLQGTYRGVDFYVRLVKRPKEYGEKYGDKVYVPIGTQIIRALIDSSKDSMFTPCRYAISSVEIVEGPPVKPVEIVSFRGRFCELAREGERITAKGKLELVRSREGDEHYRLLLGAKGDFMIVKQR